jgi:ABC-type ATPase involved in cell division
MSLLDSLKNLRPAERFKAFLIVVVLSSITPLATMYLKTDDCKGISTQYESLVDNHTKLMETNNKIIQDNTSKTEAIRRLDSILVAFSKQKAIVATHIEKIPVRHQDRVLVNETVSGENGEVALAKSVVEEPEPKVVIVKSTTTTDLNKTQKDLVKCALKITEEYKND